ncbi:MAG: transporter substrate-binding domain-containing protein [Colwellia sp.]|jgi:ABC-type amino acid transport/signal transduction systems, periplasmic component/domain
MRKIKFGQLLTILSLFSFQAVAEKLIIYTEEFPPFSYTESGEVIGASTEVIKAIMDKSGMDYQIKSYPWARSYAVVQQQKNAFIYSISRRESREALFQWVGEIVPSKQSVFALKSRTDISVESLNDLKKYKLGSSVNDARESYLFSKGFTKSDLKQIAGADSYSINYKKLKAKRIDLWPMPNAVAFHLVEQQNEDPTDVLRIVLPLTEISQKGYYFAASLKTDPALVEKLSKTLESFKTSTEYQAIISKWNL